MLQTEETFVPGKWKDRQLKPSEAMRLGAAMRPQCVGQAFMGSGSCAIGAWYEGMGYGNTYDQFMDGDGYVRFRIETGVDPADVYERNDFGRWTREQIADWLEAQGL